MSRGPYRNGESRRREILDAATAAFAENGYRGASLREIAAAINVSPGVIVHHFGSKELLLLAVIEDRDIQSYAEVEVAVGQRTFVSVLREVVERNASAPGLIALFSTLAAEAANPQHPAHAYFETRYERLVNGIAEGARKSFGTAAFRSDEDSRDFGRTVLAMMDGIQLQWLYNPSKSIVDRFNASLNLLRIPTRQCVSSASAKHFSV